MKKDIVNCIFCHNDFLVPPHRKDVAKYCSRKCVAEGSKYIVVAGEKFNRLTILREIEPELQYCHGNECKLRRVECLCDCGKTMSARLIMVRNGDTKSCGCLKKEQDIRNLDTSTHGLSWHPVYGIWYCMMARCYNSDNIKYHRYGGRGIIVCKRWKNFVSFFEDMAYSYIVGLELERKNNDGNYEPSNCKWDTRKNQTNNTSLTIRVSFNGETYPLVIICERLGFNKNQIRKARRLLKIGQSFSAVYSIIKKTGLNVN